MALTRHSSRYRAAVLTSAYVCLCIAGVLVQLAISWIDDAESAAADAALLASEALSRVEQSEDDISELRDSIENIEIQMVYR